jgi:hypothetical protein
MLIRTTRPVEIAGCAVPAGLPLDLAEAEAMALVAAGAAEPWAPPARAPQASSYAAPAAPEPPLPDEQE